MSKIPKKIHYIWVGGNPKPDIVLKCIETWKKYMPDYEIIEWNEKNYDVKKNEYIRGAYEKRKYAFVSDYMRFDILHEYGGIYMDTDVELLKSIPEEIFANDSFTGVENAGKVSPGLIFACAPQNEIVRKMKESYEGESFDEENLLTINCRITKLLNEKGFVENNQFQVIDGLAIYPDEYFCGFDQDVREIMVTENTISVHHYAATWKKKTLKNKVQMIIKGIVGVNGYRRLIHFKRWLKRK